jgi:hypothetical protein
VSLGRHAVRADTGNPNLCYPSFEFFPCSEYGSHALLQLASQRDLLGNVVPSKHCCWDTAAERAPSTALIVERHTWFGGRWEVDEV